MWKTVASLRSANVDLNVFVLDCVYGLGIVTRGSASDRFDYSEQDIGALTYADSVRDRTHFINLKGTDYFNKFIQTI